MRVLVTADTLGGVWTYTRELVTQLVRRGHEVVLVSLGNIPNAEQTTWLDGLARVDFRPTAFKLEWMQDCEADLQESSDYLLQIISETRPDLLHSSQYCYGALDCNIPKVVVAHSDVMSWWWAVHGEAPPENDWIRSYRKIVHRGLHAADGVVAVSRWMVSELNRLYGEFQRQRVIYNGRNAAHFSPYMPKEALAVSVGRLWDSGKNTKLLAKCNAPLPVCIAGVESNPETGEIIQWRHDVSVELRPQQSEAQMRMLLGRASIYVATSQYEPFGLAPLEAALSRCAILANDIDTFHELWGDRALYFRHNDVEDLKRQLQRLRDDVRLRTDLANAAYQHALAHFSASKMCEQYVDLYADLLPARAQVA
ncbi:MAG TPA: glycosyltransferase family 4 protein [Terriglobales bacterium]